ncbi:tetratricopeptide repeat protein, partial [Salinispira pacifica]
MSRYLGPRTLPLLLLLLCSVAAGGPRAHAQQIDMTSVRANDELRRGVVAFYNGYFNESIQAFQRSIQYKSDNPRAHFWLGRAYYYSGFEQAALGEWNLLIRQGQGSPYLETLVNTVSWRRGLARETSTGTRYVVSGEVSNRIEQTTLFSRPSTVVPRGDGTYYLTSFGSQQVLVVDVNGRRRETLRGGLEGFDGPFDVAQAANGRLYVSEYYGDRIALCSPDGNKIKTFGGRSASEGSLVGPQYLVLDQNGFLYVTSWGTRRVSKFDADGNLVLSFGGARGAFAGLEKPTGITVMQGRVYVADAGTRSIDIFDESGNFIGTVAEGMLSAPEGISVFAPGQLLVADTNRVVLVDVDQDTVAILSDLEGRGKRVTSAAVDANGTVLACDFDGSKVLLLSNITDLYTALFTQITRVNSDSFPTVTVEVTVEDRSGKPIVGLDASNFRVTEDGLPIAGEPELIFAGYRDRNPNIVLLADRSKEMQQYVPQLREAASGLYDAAGGGIRVVSSGKSPVLETSVTDGKQTVVTAAAANGAYGPDWSFDRGVRLAGSELLKSRGRRSIVFVTQGDLGQHPFENYGLEEISRYLKNNGITFSVV